MEGSYLFRIDDCKRLITSRSVTTKNTNDSDAIQKETIGQPHWSVKSFAAKLPYSTAMAAVF